MTRNDSSITAGVNVKDLWEQLSPESKRLVGKVIEIEKSKLHMSLPRGVNDEIVKAIKEVVK